MPITSSTAADLGGFCQKVPLADPSSLLFAAESFKEFAELLQEVELERSMMVRSSQLCSGSHCLAVTFKCQILAELQPRVELPIVRELAAAGMSYLQHV